MTEFCHQTTVIFVVRSKGILQFCSLTFAQSTCSWTSILLNFSLCLDETKNHMLTSLGMWNSTEACFVFKKTLLYTLENFDDTSVKKLAKALLLWKFLQVSQTTLCVYIKTKQNKKLQTSKTKQCYDCFTSTEEFVDDISWVAYKVVSHTLQGYNGYACDI